MARGTGFTGGPYKQCACLYVRNIKKCMRILKSLNIVNLHQEITILKLKINANLQYLSYCVLSFLQLKMANCSDLVVITTHYEETRVESSFSTAPGPSQFLPRNKITCLPNNRLLVFEKRSI